METIKLNGEEWDLDYVASMIFHAKGGLIYKKDKWKPRDALVTKDKNRATIYDGQKYDPNQFELVKGFWITIIAKFATGPSNLRTKLKMLKDI